MPKKKRKAKKTRGKKARAKKPRAKKPRAKKTRTKKKVRAKKKRRAKKAGLRLGGALKSKLRVHGHDLPTCEGNSHHASCADKNRMLSCNQVTILGKTFAVCTHLN